MLNSLTKSFRYFSTSSSSLIKRYEISSIAELSKFTTALAEVSKAGDVFFLKGELGVGKTAFAREFLRGRTGIADLEVVSPSFTLDITYHHNDVDYHHMDLYRLEQNQDMTALDLPNSMKTGVCLIEWPDRLPQDWLPTNRLVDNTAFISYIYIYPHPFCRRILTCFLSVYLAPLDAYNNFICV